MQSSYNLIRKSQALSGTSKKIATQYDKKIDIEEEEFVSEETGKTLDEINEIIKNYENIGRNIILDAHRRKDELMLEVMSKAQQIEKEAYENGYAQGKENGYEDGKNEAIKNIIPQAERQAREVIDQAEEILKNAKNDYINYLESKREDIIKLSISIAEKVIRKKVSSEDGINEILEEGISISKGEENLVIKCNPIYVQGINECIPVWKANYSIKGEIFILPNDEIPVGNAIIEKSSGKIEVGMDIGLEAIEKALLP